MPVSPININFDSTRSNVPDYGNLVENLLAGYKAGAYPAEQREAQAKSRAERENKTADTEKTQLANALTKEFGKREKESDINYKDALTKNSNNPYSHLTGLPAEFYGAEVLKNNLPGGEQHPIYKKVMTGLENKVKQVEALNRYRERLTETADKRATTTLGKLRLERDQIVNDSNIPEEEKQGLLSDYDTQIQKQISNSTVFNQAVSATNVDKTLDQLTPKIKSLVQYAGSAGKFKKLLDTGRASMGYPSEDYKKFQEAVVDADLLAKQIRFTYKDSVQPAVQEKLAALTNPATILNNPEIAENNYKEFERTIRRETETFRKAAGIRNRNRDVEIENDINAISNNSPETIIEYDSQGRRI